MKKYKRCKTSYFSAISAAGLYNGAAGRLNELYSAGLYPVEEESLFFTLFPLFLALGVLLSFWLCFAKRRAGKAFLALFLCMAVGSGGFAAFSADGMQTLQEKAADAAYRLRYGSFSENKTQLTVQMDTPQSSYLRGYIGEREECGSWKTLSGKERSKSLGLFSALHAKGFYAQTALADAGAQAAQGEADGPAAISSAQVNTLRITNTGASRQYLYTPYETTAISAELKEETGDRTFLASGFLGEKSYTLETAAIQTADRRKILTALSEKGSSQEEYNYRLFAYEQYLDLTDMQKEILSAWMQDSADLAQVNREAKAAGLTKTDAAKSVIFTLLSDDNKETRNSLGLPDEYTAYHGRTDESVSAAGAAALLFRAQGIPARYAEGYVITKSMAEDAAKDGKAAFNLTSENYHAWCEYYEDGIGWLPFESDSDMRAEMPADDLLVNAQKEKPKDEEPNPQDDSPKQDAEQTVTPQGEDESLFDKILILALCILLLLLLAGFCLYRLIRKARYRRMEPRKAVLSLMQESLKVLKRKGLSCENKPLSAYTSEMQALWGETAAASFAACYAIYARLRYGEQDGTEDDKQTLLAYRKEAGRLKRIPKNKRRRNG